MHAIQTSGNCIRNVTADHFAGAAADEIEDPRPTAELLRQWSTDHPEFLYLPRKFKIGITGAPNDRAVTKSHDIGLRMLRDADGAPGYEISIGGGLGRTPMIGKVVREFLPKADLLPYLEAILQVYNLSGRRDNKYKARLKILVHEESARGGARLGRGGLRGQQGADAAGEPGARRGDRGGLRAAGLRGAGAAAAAARRRACAPGSTPTSRAHRLDHYAIVTVSLKPIGGTPGDATAEQMRVMADLAEAFGHDELRVSHEQNIILPHVPRRHLPEIYARLKDVGLATANVGLISDIIACPGMDYCALATARSIPVAQEIAEAFADLDRQRDIGPLKIKISGCINACGHHHVGHIGILGLDRAGVENYQITLGGDGTETAAIGEKAGPGFAYDEVVPAVERLIGAYLDHRLEPGESFLAAYRRLGLEPFKAALYRRGGAVRCGLKSARCGRRRSTGSTACASTYGRGAARGRAGGVLAEFPGQVAMVSSFGAEAAVLLKMVADIDRDLPVLMIDSLMLFEETLDYQRTLSAHLGLHQRPAPAAATRWTSPGSIRTTRCTSATPTPAARSARWRRSTGRCGAGRCRSPGASASRPRRGRRWRSSRPTATRLRVNPLAHWSAADLRDYMDRHDLPRHPLVARGFKSIGCWPCTTPVRRGRGRPRRALARQREGRVRHPFRRGRPHPARGELRRRICRFW